MTIFRGFDLHLEPMEDAGRKRTLPRVRDHERIRKLTGSFLTRYKGEILLFVINHEHRF